MFFPSFMTNDCQITDLSSSIYCSTTADMFNSFVLEKKANISIYLLEDTNKLLDGIF